MTSTPTTTPTGPDADPGLTGQMCTCGRVWLTEWTIRFTAEGSEHTRNWCNRLPAGGTP